MALDFDSYVLKFLQVTEAAAYGAYSTVGLGDAKLSDEMAVRKARDVLNSIDMQGVIVVGEGERDKAPMLHIGEMVGLGGKQEIDIATDPLECTTSCALGKTNSMASLAFGKRGCFLGMPDVYMEKIAVGIPVKQNEITLLNPIEVNIKNLACLLDRPIDTLKIVVLNRPRHEELIKSIRSTGARVMLIEDGDIYGVVSTIMGDSDMYVGTGGSPEGILAAAALKCIGGFMEARLVANDEEERSRITASGIHDISTLFHIDDLAKDEVCFISTGVTDGDMVSGVVNRGGGIFSFSSIVMVSTAGGSTMLIERTIPVAA